MNNRIKTNRTARVGIIIPNYNRSEMLVRALESIHQQSFSDWHAYIIDDGTNRDEWENVYRVYNHYQDKDPRFTLLRQAHRGVSAARNLGILSGREPWIALLDSDDAWVKDKLEKQLLLAEKKPNQLCHSDELWYRRGKRVNPKLKHSKGGGNQFFPSLKFCVISPSAALIPRRMLGSWGIFDESFPIAEDYDLWLRATMKQEVTFSREALTMKHGGHEGQLSRSPLLDYWRLRSLAKIYFYGDLNEIQKKAVYEEMWKKIAILKQGAEKRENLELLSYLQMISSNLT